MNYLKDYLKHKGNRGRLASRIIEVKGEIDRLAEALQPLEDESLKSEILETPDFKQKKEAVKAQRQRIISLKTELDDSKKKLKVMDSILPEFQKKAYKEATGKHREIFEKALKPFVAKLQDVLEEERALKEIQKKACMEFSDNGLGFCPIVDWIPFLQRTYEHPGSERAWEEQIKRWKNEGYKID